MEASDLSSPSKASKYDHIHNIKSDNANATATATSPAASVDHQHYNHFDRIVSNSNNINAGAAPAAADEYFSSEIIEIMEEDEETSITSSSSATDHNRNETIGKTRGQPLTRISESGIETNTTSLFSIDIHNNNIGGGSSDGVVYVAVGKSESSMDALLWTLNHAVLPGSSVVYLIHIFSDLKFIPSPFGGGLVPKTQVSPDLVEKYLVEDTRKRRDLLNKYVDICTSHMVHVETILIESDSVASAIVELISVLKIRQLVVGISKSNLRKLKVGRGSATVADQIRQRAADHQGFELTIVCQGKQLNMSELHGSIGGDLHSISASSTPTLASSGRPHFDDEQQQQQQQPTSYSSFTCCFKG